MKDRHPCPSQHLCNQFMVFDGWGRHVAFVPVIGIQVEVHTSEDEKMPK
jgi:hypothetical protein